MDSLHGQRIRQAQATNDLEADKTSLVCRGFAANAAGERMPGDLVVAVGGERVNSSEDVLAIIEQFAVGDQVPITLQRGSQQVVVNVPVLEGSE